MQLSVPIVFSIDLVPQNQEGHLGQGIIGQQLVQLVLSLEEAQMIRGIHQENNALNGSKVILPQSARSQVTAEIVGLEANAADLELLELRVPRRFVNDQLIIPITQ